MKNLIQWFICVLVRGEHKTVFWRNLNGDEINQWGARSIYKCRYCGTIEKSFELNRGEA